MTNTKNFPVYVGIDGGGTKTSAVAIDSAGNVLARAQGGAGLIDPNAPAEGAAALAALARRVLTEAGGAPARAMCCALAGAGREPQRAAIEDALKREDIAPRIVVATDAEAAMRDAFGSGPGILLIAGTGSIAWGRNAAGEVRRVGGWGKLLGDEGSGYAIGLAALRAVLRAEDGRAPATTLRQEILDATSQPAPGDLVAWAAAASKSDIAALAEIVLARTDDAVSRVIIRAAADALAAHVQALDAALRTASALPTSGNVPPGIGGDKPRAARQGGLWPEPETSSRLIVPPGIGGDKPRAARQGGPAADTHAPPILALTGGLLAPDSPLRAELRTALESRVGALPTLDREIDAARGAALLAFDAADADANNNHNVSA